MGKHRAEPPTEPIHIEPFSLNLAWYALIAVSLLTLILVGVVRWTTGA